MERTDAPKTASVVVQARYTHIATERRGSHIYASTLGEKKWAKPKKVVTSVSKRPAAALRLIASFPAFIHCLKTDLLYSFVCSSVLELGMLEIIVYIEMFEIIAYRQKMKTKLRLKNRIKVKQ